MIDDTDQTHKPPKESEANWDSPEYQRSTIAARIWRCSRLSGKGLGGSRTKASGVCVGSLLIDQRGSYDVRRSATVALIGRLLLKYGSHLVVPDLATACDTWFLNTDSSAVLQNRSNPLPQNRSVDAIPRSAKAHEMLGIGPFPDPVPRFYLTEF